MASRPIQNRGNLNSSNGVQGIEMAILVHEKEYLEMNRTHRHVLSVILLIALLAVSTSVVLAKELGLLTISGPGIKGEVTLKDPKAMMGLEQSGFFDQTSFIKPPANLGEGYNLTAHLNLDGKMVPFVEMVYYPTNEGEPGYVHYTGRLNGEKLQTVDQWQTLSLRADKAFRNLMMSNNVTLQSALITAPVAEAPAVKEPAVQAPAVEPMVAPAVTPSPAQTSYLIPTALAVILLFVGAGFILRRRTIRRTTT
jgi:hypothetical protein